MPPAWVCVIDAIPLSRLGLLAALAREPRLAVLPPGAPPLRQGPAVVLAHLHGGPPGPALLAAWRRWPGVPSVLLEAARWRPAGPGIRLPAGCPPEDLLRAVLLAAGRKPRKAVAPFGRLTPREREILALLAQRRDAREIAAALGVTYQTARTHLRNLYSKCGVRSRLEACRFAAAVLGREGAWPREGGAPVPSSARGEESGPDARN